MARVMLFLFLLATIALALPSRLQKRSFKTPVRGRTQQGPLDDFLRVHQKYDWTIVVAESEPGTTSTPTASTSSTVYGTSANINTLTTVSATQSITTPATYLNATSAQGSEDGEVTAIPEANEIEYLSPVVIGGQSFNLNFDTGSSDLWVFSTSLLTSSIGNHSAYDASSSHTYTKLEGGTWSIQYGDSSGASGTVGFDTVDVGGSTVDKQCIELATTISKSFVADAASDGLLGLGFSSINRVEIANSATPQKTFFENVINDLSEPLFTANLKDNMGGGTYEFGLIDNSKFTGDVYYADVDNSQGWWQISVPNVRIGANQTLKCNGECLPAIADTGTSLLYLDYNVVKAYYKEVPGHEYSTQGAYIYPCGTVIPDLSLEIGGRFFTIKGEDMTYMAFTGNDDGGQPGQCMGGLQAGPRDMQILGDVFLKQIFAVFDGGNMRFGVAEQN